MTDRNVHGVSAGGIEVIAVDIAKLCSWIDNKNVIWCESEDDVSFLIQTLINLGYKIGFDPTGRAQLSIGLGLIHTDAIHFASEHDWGIHQRNELYLDSFFVSLDYRPQPSTDSLDKLDLGLLYQM